MVAWSLRDAVQRGFDRLAEVGVEPGQQRQRQGRDQIIGAYHLFAAAAAVVVGHRHAVIPLANLANHRAQLHMVTHALVEGVGDAVHAADGLEHGRGKFRELGVQQRAPQLGMQQPIQPQRCAAGRQGAGMGKRFQVPRTKRALKGQLLGQVAIHLQKAQQARALLTAQYVIEGIALHRFGQQAGHMPARIVDRLADRERRLPQIGPYLGAVAAVDQHFQGHTEFAAIVEERAVLARNPGRAGVEIQARIEGHGLRAAIGVGHAITLAQGPGAPADAVARLQHLYVEPGAAEFQGGDQPGNPRAQHQHAGALPQALLELQRLRAAVR